jgi:hypothetical protein
MAVEGDGVATDDDELGAGVGQRQQEVAEVVGELDHVGGRGTKRQGVSRRV